MIPTKSYITPEEQYKLDISEQESFDLAERDLRCPHCRFLITKIFSDAVGHMKVKCHKCKRLYVLDLQRFRTACRSVLVTLTRIIE